QRRIALAQLQREGEAGQPASQDHHVPVLQRVGGRTGVVTVHRAAPASWARCRTMRPAAGGGNRFAGLHANRLTPPATGLHTWITPAPRFVAAQARPAAATA